MTQIRAPKSAEEMHLAAVARYAVREPNCPACYKAAEDMKSPFTWLCDNTSCNVITFAGPKEATPF